ncbi:hypothetical protein [Cohnella algarum]|uniref:hypothetical protein n=1 Tax=Cohnella algarum TaxID=2044859 RepID=UPI001967B0CD|nr:hypothetical protein [Cohnella algarum]MBN2982830.1 hypothetical protein [Cohnella algarum]
MKPHMPLFKLEWSAYVQPGIVKTAASAYALLLALAVVFLQNSLAPEKLLSLGALIVCCLGTGFSLLPSLTIWENPFREWWLAMPHSRLELLRAKMSAAYAAQAIASLGLWTVSVLQILGSRTLFGTPLTHARGDELLGISLAYLALFWACGFVFTTFGFLLIGFFRGWRQWLTVPYFCIVMLPFGMFPLLALSTDVAPQWFAADRVAVYAGIGLLFGLLLKRATIRFVSRRGMADLARYRSGMKSSSERGDESVKPRFRSGASGGFRALYALERSRFRHFARLKPARAVRHALLALAAVAGVFAFGESETMFVLPVMILYFAGIGPLFMLAVMLQHDAGQRRLVWWLAMPYARRTLLFSRMLAVWVTLLRGSGLAFAAFALGAAARWAVSGWPSDSWSRDAATFAYLAFCCCAFSLLMTFVLAIGPFLYKNAWTSALFLPLYGGAGFLPTAINRWVLPAVAKEQGIGNSQWAATILAIAVCLPAAWGCFALGAKWLHLHLFQTQEAGRRAFWSRDGKTRSG